MDTFGAGQTEIVPTPYGDAAITRVNLAEREVIFLARHGAAHILPPHRINYRANIWALHALGVKDVLATQAVGSLNPHMEPGSLVILGQFIDWTRGRNATFFDGEHGQVVHVDVSKPYCPRLSAQLQVAGDFLAGALHGDGEYACSEGPRFETAAEVRMLRQLGADVVGMTNVPEVVLAREAGLCYAALCVVCNWGAGMAESPLTHDEVLGVMSEQATRLRRMIEQFIHIRSDGECACAKLGFAHWLPQLPCQ